MAPHKLVSHDVELRDSSKLRGSGRQAQQERLLERRRRRPGARLDGSAALGVLLEHLFWRLLRPTVVPARRCGHVRRAKRKHAEASRRQCGST
eukprot:423144-Prymnesium_polylepis.2